MKYSVTQKDKQLRGVASSDVPFIIQFGLDGDGWRCNRNCCELGGIDVGQKSFLMLGKPFFCLRTACPMGLSQISFSRCYIALLGHYSRCNQPDTWRQEDNSKKSQ